MTCKTSSTKLNISGKEFSEVSLRIQEQKQRNKHSHNKKGVVSLRAGLLNVIGTFRSPAHNLVLAQEADPLDDHVVLLGPACLRKIAESVKLHGSVSGSDGNILAILRREA